MLKLSYTFSKMESSTILTQRLRLEPICSADSAFIYALLNSPDWIKFIGDRKILSLEDAGQYIDRIVNNPDTQIWCMKLCDDTSVGIISFIKRAYLPHHDLGFALLPEYYHHGYAKEAAEGMLIFQKKEFKHQTILATTLADNFSSIGLLEKLGFGFEKKIEFEEVELLLFSI
jgi:[ribosomal protein S5]-alanine N-acetyltransferase